MAEETRGLPPWIKALFAFAALAFAANAAFVWASLSGRRDLVRRDYYAAGLEQDARLARRALAARHHLELVAGREWSVAAAPPVDGGSRPALEGADCRVSFRRPEDGREDRAATLAWTGGSAGAHRWAGPGHPLRRGRWDVLIEWERDGKVIMESALERFVE